MKDFLKYVLATVVGVVIVTVLAGIIGTVSIIGMVASSSSSTDVKDKSVFVLNLSGSLEERCEDNVMSRLNGRCTNSGIAGHTVGH